MSYVEDCVERLNLLPASTSRHLRKIQELDKKTESIATELEQKQKEFIERFRQQKGKKLDNKTREQLESQYRGIVQLHKQGLSLCTQKVSIAGMLYDLVHEPTEKMDGQLARMAADLRKNNQLVMDDERDPTSKTRRPKEGRGNPPRQEEQFDKNEPVYCYCGKPSFGQMVMCEGSLCQKEWFHRDCIHQKNLPDKWFCLECRKQKDRRRQSRQSSSYL